MSFELMYYDCDRGDVSEIQSFCIFPTPRLSTREYGINACAYECKICEECAEYTQRIKKNYLYDDPVDIIYGDVSKDVAILHDSSLIFVSIPKMYSCERCRTSTYFNIQYNTRTHNYIVEYENYEGPQAVNYHIQQLSKNYSDHEGNLEVYIIYVQGIGPLFCLTNGEVILYLPSVSIIKLRYQGWHSIIKMTTGGTFSVFRGVERGRIIVLDNFRQRDPVQHI